MGGNGILLDYDVSRFVADADASIPTRAHAR
jgi:hypothetical protein